MKFSFDCSHVLRRAAVPALALLIAGPTAVMAADAPPPAVPENDLLNATLWMDTSVEYKATVLGIFQLAKMRLDEALADNSWNALPDMSGGLADNAPIAIIADLDETLLDNDPYEASLVTRHSSYGSKDYNAYVQDEVAGAIPGAVDFLNYAASKGVKIYYVSNRKAAQEDATRANMEKLGFPMGSGNEDMVLLQNEKPEWTGAKESRLQFIAKDNRVLLVMGDNLGDFSNAASGSLEERDAFLQASMDHWGHDWIMLPNAEYGSFESAAFGGDWSKSPDQRRQDKIDSLKPWVPSEE